MLLSRFELEFGDTSIGCARKSGIGTRVVHASVDQIVVRGWDGAVHGTVHEGIVVRMVPIGKDYWANIDIILGMLRSVDDHWTVSTARVLGTVVA